MAENKKSFLLYCDQIESFECLEDDEAGRLIKHIFRYVNDKNPEAPDRITKISFEPIKNQLKRDLLKYEEIRVKRSLAGVKSAEQRQQKATSVESVEHDITNPTVIDNVNDTDNVKVNVTVSDKEKEKKKEINNNIAKTKVLVHPSFSFIKNAFLSYYLEQKQLNYNWQPIDGTKTNSIIKKILFQVKTTYPDTPPENEEKKINDGFIFILKNLNDNWIIENLSLAIIDSKFNTIISKIKNPTKNGKPTNHLEQRRAEILSKYNS